MNTRRAHSQAAWISGARFFSLFVVCGAWALCGSPGLAHAQDARVESEGNPTRAPKTGEMEPPVDVPREPVTPPAVVPEPEPPAEPQTPLDAQPAPTREVGEAVPVVSDQTSSAEQKSTSDLPPDGLPVPVYVPPEAAGAAAVASTKKKEDGPLLDSEDSIKYSGYLPGYRRHMAFGASPIDPKVGPLPGGVTPGYGAPVPPSEWTFTFSGFMSVSAQMSFDKRHQPTDDQSRNVTHVMPTTLDTYYFFTSTNSVPGNWVNMRFRYGNSKVSANLTFDTYNPTEPTSYYQMGSQFFINNAYLQLTPSPIGGVRFEFNAGRFNINYGSLARYGSGMYTPSITAMIQGTGLRSMMDFMIGEKVKFVAEHNLMTDRDGTIPQNVVRSQANGWRRPQWTGSLINGLHVGFDVVGENRTEFRLHYVNQLGRDDRLQHEIDDAGTRHIDERHMKDQTFHIFGGDVKFLSERWGVVGVGASYAIAQNSYPLRGVFTYAGVGEDLTERFLGQPSAGTGDLFVAAVNYEGSTRRLVVPTFDGQGMDLIARFGFHYTLTQSEFEDFDGRARYKGGVELEYIAHKYIALALRGDRVVPSSRDMEQTYHVLAPRLIFRTGWGSRMNFNVMYAHWFLGPETRIEGAGDRSPTQLDDDFFALNMNMWW